MSTAELFANDWSPDGWRRRSAQQQPDWPDTDALEQAEGELRGLPPLVFAGEARTLTESLAAAQDGRAFLLVAGDCAESFQAFSAEDAQRLASALVSHTEGFLNSLNARAQQDAIQSAIHDVDLAKEAAYKALDGVTAFRNTEEIVDPTKASAGMRPSLRPRNGSRSRRRHEPVGNRQDMRQERQQQHVDRVMLALPGPEVLGDSATGRPCPGPRSTSSRASPLPPLRPG